MDSLILGIGAGRDGTTSLTKILQEIFRLNDHDGEAVHQQDHRLLYNEFCLWKETEDIRHRDEMSRVIARWRPGDAIVGNGYAHYLDLVRDIQGPQVKLICLRREKGAGLESFAENVRTFPWSHGNYSGDPAPRQHRIAAFHCGEMTRREWDALPLEDKLSWYYDKTHAALNEQKGRFEEVLEVATENLSADHAVEGITEFLDPGWIAPSKGTRVNASRIDYRSLDDEERVVVNRVYNEYDFLEAAKDPLVGEQYFADRVLAGFVHRDQFEHSTVSEEALRDYMDTLKARLAEVERLLLDAGE